MPRLALDVSNVNPISAADLRASGAALLICKATEGASFKDATLARHRSIAREAGVGFGSYLFLHARSAGDEARLYLAHAKPVRGDVQPIIDAEQGGLDGAGIPEMAKRVDSCALALEAHGYRPLLYASSSFWLEMRAARPTLRRLRVWEAQYPGRFTRWTPRLARLRVRLRHGATVVMWQWTDTYAVGGKRYDASRLMVPLDSLRIP